MFLNGELNQNKLEVDKWDMEINKLIEYKYKNDIQIVDIIKAIQTEKRQHKDIIIVKCEIYNNRLYY